MMPHPSHMMPHPSHMMPRPNHMALLPVKWPVFVGTDKLQSTQDSKVFYFILIQHYNVHSYSIDLSKEMNPHHMVTPVQQQDTYSYTTRTELSSTGNNELLMMNGLYVDTAVSECTEDTQSIEEPSIRGNGEVHRIYYNNCYSYTCSFSSNNTCYYYSIYR